MACIRLARHWFLPFDNDGSDGTALSFAIALVAYGAAESVDIFSDVLFTTMFWIVELLLVVVSFIDYQYSRACSCNTAWHVSAKIFESV